MSRCALDGFTDSAYFYGRAYRGGFCVGARRENTAVLSKQSKQAMQSLWQRRIFSALPFSTPRDKALAVTKKGYQCVLSLRMYMVPSFGDVEV